MGAVYFYHLTRRPLEVALAELLPKARAAGWRVAVRGTSSERLDWLDQALWLGDDAGFLPHGVEGGAHDARQPVLLTLSDTPANAPQCLMVIDGADVRDDEVSALERVCVLFDGNDATGLQKARSQWKTLTEAGCPAQYWSEESGNWQKKAER